MKRKQKKPFRLMSLPFVAFRHSLYQTDFYDILNLALVSKKTQQKVKACALQATDVELSLKSNYEKELNVMFGGKKYTWKAIETVIAKHRKYVADHHDNAMFDLMCSRIFNILNKKSVDTFRFDRNIELKDISKNWEIIKEAINIYTATETLMRDVLDMVLNKFERINTLFVDTNLPLLYDGFTKKKFKNLYLGGENTVFSSKDFMEIETDVLLIQSSSMDVMVLHEFLLEWTKLPRNPDKREPQVIRIFNIKADDSILQGIHTHLWNPKHRGKHYVIHLENGAMAVDCSKERDLMRPDGKLATVLVTKSTFDFFVWERTFHKIPANAVFG